VAAHKKLHRLWRWYALLAGTALVMLAGFAALIEMIYARQFGSVGETTARYLGLTLDTATLGPWLAGAAVALVGLAAFEAVRRRFAEVWGTVQEEIEATMTFKEPS
jgi:branched-chain amino acid transport system permease protein